MSETEELQEARYWAEEARRCARISVWLGDLSFALAVVGFALSAWCVFLKHSAVGEDGVGRAASSETVGDCEDRVSAGRDGAYGSVVPGHSEGILERDAAKPDLADGERHGAGVGDQDGRDSDGVRRATYRALGRLPFYLMLDGTCSGVGTTFGSLGIAADMKHVRERDGQGDRGKNKADGFVRFHGGDYSKGADGAQAQEQDP